ncbi:unnamed protein product [Cunninghamella blakesleeana]
MYKKSNKKIPKKSITEWSTIISKFTKIKNPKTDPSVTDTLSIINKEIGHGNLDRAFQKARKLQLNATGNSSIAAEIYSCLIKMYKHKPYLFQSNSLTEYDSVMKIWSVIFENLFEGSPIIIKW